MDYSVPLHEEHKRYYINNLTYVLNWLSSSYNLPQKVTIVIPDDFEKELTEFQLEKNLPVGFTKNACAKVLDYKDNDLEENVSIFIDKKIIFKLQGDENENSEEQKNEIIKLRNLAINIIHHELMHVYDNHIAGNKYKQILDNNTDEILINRLVNLAMVLWKEYFACRSSAITYNMDFEHDVNELIQQILEVEEKIKEVIREYRFHGDIEKIETELLTTVKDLLIFNVYFQGHLFGDSNNLGDLTMQLIRNIMSQSFLADIWSNMFYDLNELFDTYLKWDKNAFEKLSQTILKCWNNLGVFPKETENGIYYSIPK